MKVPLTKYAVSFTRVMLQRCHNEGQKWAACCTLLSLQFKSPTNYLHVSFSLR